MKIPGARQNKTGVTLVELLITISVISVGIFPLIAALGNVSESAVKQRDQLSAMNLGNLLLDSWIVQFQTIDNFLDENAGDYPASFTVVTPTGSAEELGFPRNDGVRSAEIFYNKGFFRMESIFTYLNGTNLLPGTESSPDLSNSETVVYSIQVKVWKINTPEINEYGETLRSSGEPGFLRGDEPLYEVSSLYSQTNRIQKDSELQ